MKRMIVLSLGLLAATVTNAQAKLTDIDVSSNEGYPYIVKAPAGAKVEEKYGELYVTFEKSFETELSVGEEPYDVAKRKKEIKDNTINKLKRWVTDTPEGGIYETEVFSRAQFHFVYTVKIGDKYLTFEDHKSGDTYTLPQVQAMYDAVKATHAK